MTDDDLEILRLVKAYREACDKVEPAWQALLHTPVFPDEGYYPTRQYHPDRVAASRAYSAASRNAQAARLALLIHTLGDRMEVGGARGIVALARSEDEDE